MDSTDDQFLERLRQGDRQAFEELFAQYRPELLRFIEIRLEGGMRGRVDVSDVVQEAQLDAFKRLEDFLEREPMPLRIWLYKTAYESLIKVRRRHHAALRSVSQEQRLPQRSSVLIARQLLSGMKTPSQQFSRRETNEKIAACLAELEEIDREILVMRNHEERPYDEIALLLEIEPAAARKRYGRALLRLRAALVKAGLLESSP